MPHARIRRSAGMIAVGTLLLALLACGSSALLVRRDALSPFVKNIPIWPGTLLTHRNGPDGVCHPLVRCPRQIGLRPGLSVWLTWQAQAPTSRDEIGRRLRFIPSGE